MNTNEIVAAIDVEIQRLRQVRTLLDGFSGKRVATTSASSKKQARRRLSPEARARIAAAQKARWAKLKKSKEPLTKIQFVQPSK